jgi:hypothetical protein
MVARSAVDVLAQAAATKSSIIANQARMNFFNVANVSVNSVSLWFFLELKRYCSTAPFANSYQKIKALLIIISGTNKPAGLRYNQPIT